MSDQAALDAFLDKWRARWPEWRIAEAFVPPSQRAATFAWLALRQELADAAWQGADPRPGEAKLAWWGDELQGWANGRRRHPLGLSLQRIAAPWHALAGALPALAASRELAAAAAAGDVDARWRDAIAPFAEAGAQASAAIAVGVPPPASRGDAGAAGSGAFGAFGASLAAARALAGEGSREAALALLDAWPPAPAGTRADRIFAAIARLRLQAFAAGAGGSRPPGHWRVLWAAWRAGRSVPPA